MINYSRNSRFSCLALVALLLFSCNSGQNSEKVSNNDSVSTKDTAKAVSTTPPDSANALDATTSATAKPNEVVFHGTIVLSPEKHASVSVLMDGMIKHTSLLAGKYVRKGAIVASVVNQDFVDLQQTYLDSHAQVEFLRAEYQRQKTLASQKAASDKKLQQSKAEYLSMVSRLQASAVRLNLLGLNPGVILRNGIQPYLFVKAPVSGYVSNVSVNVGKYVHTGDALCEIIDKSSPMLKLTTYEKDITKLHVGSALQFKVNSMEEKTFNAVVVSVGQNVDPINRSLEVYARVTSRNVLFRPGMYVSVRLIN
jgi:membrane fusion protein, heavy metal efflux system